MVNGRTRNGSSVAGLSLLLTVALAAPAWSQVQSGRIVGTVRDAQQATVPKATVTVTSSATGQSLNVTTNDSGDYVVTPVNPGLYKVTVALGGFQTAVVNAVEVPVAQSVRVDVELKIGAVAETTEVTATAPLLDTESGTLGQSVTNAQIVEPAPQRPQLLRAGPPDPGGRRPAGRSECRADPRELHQRYGHQRRAGQPAHVPDRRRGRDGPSSGRHVHPDLRRRPPGVQGPTERVLRRVQPGGGHAERRHQVRGERVPRRALRVPAQRRVRRRGLLREAEAGAEPAPVRRDAGRPAREGQDVLLRELRRNPREPAAPGQPDRRLCRHEAGRLQRHQQQDLRSAHGPTVSRQRHPGEPAVAPGALLRPAHPRSQHEHGDPRLVRGPRARTPTRSRSGSTTVSPRSTRSSAATACTTTGWTIPARTWEPRTLPTRPSAALTSIPAARTWSRPSRARSARPC